jgi:hypothetical protein
MASRRRSRALRCPDVRKQDRAPQLLLRRATTGTTASTARYPQTHSQRGPTGFRSTPVESRRTRPHPHESLRAAWGKSLLFRASAKTVAVMAFDGSLFLHLTEQFVHKHGYRPGVSEMRSWERSIPLLTAALNDAGLGNVEVMLEYALPLNSKRADVVLAGLHPVTQEPSYVVVELKQWSQAAPHEDDPALCHVDAYVHPVLNPIEQVRRYCDYLVNFNGAVAEHGDRIQGVAFLHNATEFGVTGLREIERDGRGLLFTGESRGAFMDHLRSKLSDRHSGARAADELLAGATVPSKQLMSVAAQEVKERQQFVLRSSTSSRSPTAWCSTRWRKRSGRTIRKSSSSPAAPVPGRV